MKKLTAGIFAGILTIVTVNAARADIATTNYVNQNVDTKVGSLAELTTTAKTNTVAAINEVKGAVTTALSDAKDYADDLNTAMDARVAANEAELSKLNADAKTEGSIANLISIATMDTISDLTTLEGKVEKLQGNVDTEGSVANSIAAAIGGLDGNITGTGVVKTITQTDGKVTATLSAVSKTDLDTVLSSEIDAKMATSAYNTATKMAADGAYAKRDNTVGANLTALDTQVKSNADAIASLTGDGADSVKTQIKDLADDVKETTDGLNTRLTDAETDIDKLQEDVTAAKATITQHTTSITNLTNNKADAADVYTKTEIDGKVDTINTSINGKVTATNLQNKLLTTTAAGQLQDASTGLTKPAECSNPDVTCMLINDGTKFTWEKIVDKYTASAN